MINKLHWKIVGKSSHPNLILLHGWGVSSQVWEPLIEPLQQCYCLHLVDLPGYGKSRIVETVNTIYDLSERIYQQAPKSGFWLGWSLGGLIATNIALNHTQSVKGLITIASSPCFIANRNWQGLDANVFEQFASNLQQDLQSTLKKFIALQCMGDRHAKTTQRYLLNLLDPTITQSTLQWGLKCLQQTDLRKKIDKLTIPHLSILGREDKIVPATIATKSSYVINHASHLPFISDTNRCIELINHFILDGSK